MSDTDRHSYERVRALFLEACDLSEGERSAFLERECGNQPDVRRAVEDEAASRRSSP